LSLIVSSAAHDSFVSRDHLDIDPRKPADFVNTIHATPNQIFSSQLKSLSRLTIVRFKPTDSKAT
jgi:hypothetical protein